MYAKTRIVELHVDSEIQFIIPNDLSTNLPNKFHIPSVSVKGALRHGFRSIFGKSSEMETILFGDLGNKGHLIVTDFEATEFLIRRHSNDFSVITIPVGTMLFGKISLLNSTLARDRAILDIIIKLLAEGRFELGSTTTLEFRPSQVRVELQATSFFKLIFISYSWDSDAHVDWVGMLADRLEAKGYQVVLDQYDLRVGSNLQHFMETSIKSSHNVLLVMTPRYCDKAKNREGGVGYEFSIIAADLATNLTRNVKYLPLLRSGSVCDSIPMALRAFLYCDFRRDMDFEERYIELISALNGKAKRERPQSH